MISVTAGSFVLACGSNGAPRSRWSITFRYVVMGYFTGSVGGAALISSHHFLKSSSTTVSPNASSMRLIFPFRFFGTECVSPKDLRGDTW